MSNEKRLHVVYVARDKILPVCDKRDTKKKRFIDALTAKGTVYHAAQAAGISRQTAYRWREEDLEFEFEWDQALENAVDQVENTIYQQAVGGNTLAAIFYLKAHRPIYRDRLNIDIEQVRGEIEERIAQLRENPDLLPRVFADSQLTSLTAASRCGSDKSKKEAANSFSYSPLPRRLR